MAVTRNLAMADIDTQLQQAALFAHPPTTGTLPTAPLASQQASNTQQLPESFPTVQLPPTGAQNKPVTGEETVRLAPYVPSVAPGELAPPPPRSSQNRAQQERRDLTLAQRAQQQRLRFALQAASLGRSVGNFWQSSNRNLGSIPTPGGIWTPFWILVGLFFILIPVNGHTRLNWFWLALIGAAQIDANLSTSVGTAIQTSTNITTIPFPTPTSTPGPSGPIPLTSQPTFSLSGSSTLPLGNYLFGLNVQTNDVGGL